MSMVSHLTILGLLLIGLLQLIPAVIATCSSNPNCVPENACDACKELKCKLYRARNNKATVDCSRLTPEIGGNQCCNMRTVAKFKSRRKRQAYNFADDPARKWPNPIGYSFDTSISSTSKTAIQNALGHIQAQTCLRFVQVDSNSTTPNIFYTTGSSCTAYVGRSDYTATPITGTTDCLSKMGEMLYLDVQTAGVWHYSQRPDSPNFITVNTTNTDSGHIADFATLNSNVLLYLGFPYDYASIQHFAALAFSSNGLPTIRTNDPLYQQTIGQKVQLSFLDAKMLNIMYNCQDQCTSSPLASTCQNGGYQDPNNCTRCKCPDGFAGQYCDQFETATGGVCGGLVAATPTELYVTSQGYVSPGYYNEQIGCTWHIVAQKGGQISLSFVDAFGIYQDQSYACYHWVEIRYKGPLNETGPRFCGQALPQVTLTSNGSDVLVIFRSNLTGRSVSERRGFKLAYKVVNAPNNCAYVTCLNGGSCIDGACNCPAYASGTNCETIIGPVPTSLPQSSPSSPPSASSPPPPSSCTPNPCRNNGTCTMNGNVVTCQCINGFNGQYCTNAPCGGCSVSPGVIDNKCVVPQNPPKVCQVTDCTTTTSGWWLWATKKTTTVTRNVTCTWSVCCDNAKEISSGCVVLGWTNWSTCLPGCGGGRQCRTQYGFQSYSNRQTYYTSIGNQQRNCTTPKCVCSGTGRGGYDYDDDDDDDKRKKRDYYGYRGGQPCKTCNTPTFVESNNQCVPAS